MDKISIVSSQAAFELSSFSVDTCSMSSLPLLNSLIKNQLFKTAPDIDEPPFQFIHTMDFTVVNTMLHDSPDLVIHRTEIWAVRRPQVGHKKVWHFLMQQFNWLHMHGTVCRCTVLLEHKVVPIHSAYRCSSIMSLWHHAAASKKSVRDITRISCFVTTMKLPHALQLYSTVSVKECTQLPFSR